jgi:Protein of unknown function (DUF3667)
VGRGRYGSTDRGARPARKPPIGYLGVHAAACAVATPIRPYDLPLPHRMTRPEPPEPPSYLPRPTTIGPDSPLYALSQEIAAATLPPPDKHPPPPGDGPRPPRRRWWRRAKETRKTPDRPCLNCGDESTGIYCPQCGQRKVDVRVSLRRMLVEVLDDQLSLNSTLPRTLGALFLRPGHLTREYVQGRIVRYIPPFRLYLVSSLLFFILVPLVPGVAEINFGEGELAKADSVRIAMEVDSVLLARARAAKQDTSAFKNAARGKQTAGLDIQFGPNPDDVPHPLRPLAERMKVTEKRLNALPRSEAYRLLRDAFIDNAPTGIFLMMPLFALILKILYLRRKRFYVEHFVFALHQHSFAFMLFTVMMVVQQDWLAIVGGTWFIIALYMAMKRVYGQGWFRTLYKFALLSLSYVFIVFTGVAATVVLAALSM